MGDTNQSFDALMRRLAAGSEEAGWVLLENYSSNILRAVRRHLPAKVRRTIDSTDIVQSVWKSLLRKGPELETLGTPNQLIAYLAGMARLKILEAQRAHDRRQPPRPKCDLLPPSVSSARAQRPLPIDVDQCRGRRGKSPSSIVQFRETWNHALKQLGQRGYRVVELRLQGLTLEQIADELELGKRTVQRTLAALLESLEA